MDNLSGILDSVDPRAATCIRWAIDFWTTDLIVHEVPRKQRNSSFDFMPPNRKPTAEELRDFRRESAKLAVRVANDELEERIHSCLSAEGVWWFTLGVDYEPRTNTAMSKVLEAADIPYAKSCGAWGKVFVKVRRHHSSEASMDEFYGDYSVYTSFRKDPIRVDELPDIYDLFEMDEGERELLERVR